MNRSGIFLLLFPTMGISRSNSHKRRATGGKRIALRKKRKFELARPAAMTKLLPKRIRTVRGRGGNLKYRALRNDQGNYSWGTEACTRKTRILAVLYNASNNEYVRTNTLMKNTIVQVDATPFRQFFEKRHGVELGKKKAEKVETPAQPETPAAKPEAAAEKPKAQKEAKKDAKKPEASKKKDSASKKTEASTKKDAKKPEAKKEEAKKTTPPAATTATTATDASKKPKKVAAAARGAEARVLDPSLEEQFATGRLLACISSRPGQSGRVDGYILEGRELDFYQKKIHQKKKGQKQ